MIIPHTYLRHILLIFLLSSAHLYADLLCHFTLDQLPIPGAISEETGNLPGTLVSNDATTPTLGDSAWDFNNSPSWVEAGPNTTTDLMGDITNTSGLTVAFWMNRDSGAPVFERLCGLWGRFDFHFGNNGSLTFQSSEIGSYLQSGISITDSQWHHVASVIDYSSSTDNVRLYIDGVQVSSESISITSNFNSQTNKQLIIGARVNKSYHYNGKLDDFRVYGHPLSANEVAHLVNPPSTTLAAIAFDMDQAPTAGADVIIDSTGNANGTLAPSSAGLPAHITGARNMAWGFDSFNGSLQTGPNPITQSVGDITATDGITVGFWFKQSAAHANWTRVYTLWNTIDSMFYNGDIVLRFSNGATEVRIGGLFDDTWHHLVATADFTSATDNVNLYVDGHLTVTKSHTFNTSFNKTDKALNIGANTNGNGNAFDGAVDEFVLFTKALSADDVDLLYTQGSSLFINMAPVVDAGPVQTTSLVSPAIQLSGNITDDGSFTSQWSLLNGPGSVTLGNASSTSTTATFSDAGQYTLQLTANDGVQSISDTVSITVYDNLPPTVTTGNPQYIVLPQAQVTLTGNIEDDGNNAIPTWTQIRGAAANISGANTLTLSITLPAIEDEYVFRLTADDGVNSNYAEVSVYLHDATNLPSTPIVNAGSSRTVWLPNAELDLSGSYFNGVATAINWSQVQGPGTTSFGASTSLKTTAQFSAPGVYVLELEINSNGQIGTDKLVVEVYAEADDFGYSREELDLNATRDLQHEYDYIGFDFSRVAAPPAVGTHPRILVNPSDRADILNRLTTTAPGIEVMTRIKDRLQNAMTGTGASTIPTQQPSNEDYNELYRKMATGDTTVFPQVDVTTYLDSNGNAGGNNKDGFVALLTYEAFRCWVEQDTAAAANAAAVFDTLAVHVTKEINAALPTTDYRNDLQGIVHRQYLGFAYDFLHPFMTTQQRDNSRAMLVLATTDMWSIGMDSLPIYGANTSNWVATHAMHLLINTLAIEGETGADPDMYPRLVATFERFYNLGLFRSGMTDEGLGKNSIIAEATLAMAKRGDRLIASKSIKNHVQKHYAYSMVPWGNTFTWDESLGYIENESRYVDVPCIKYVYPNDEIIDFVYRNDLKGDSLSRLNDYNIRFPYKAMDFLVRAITAEDWDTSKTWEQALPDLNALPLTSFCNERGRMITRNNWSSDTLQLHFQPRSALGGHNFEDRNHIIINALGRNWLTRNAYHKVDHEYHSILTIDDEGPSVLPAAVVSHYDTGDFSLTAGDATTTYNWKVGGVDPAEWNYNQFRLLTSEEPYLTMPASDLANWQTSQRSNSTWEQFNTVEYVYRTATLVRGTHPYVLVVDDAKKDNAVHEFGSRLQLPSDVTANINGLDVTLVPDNGDERMLIRAFDVAGSPSFSVESNPDGSQALILKTTAVTPNFKMIFFPHMQGDSIPTVSAVSTGVWNVSISGQQDILTFTANPSGLSNTIIQRQ